MLSTNGSRTAKISRDVSNFIVTQVLERSDDLIKNSYRRLTTENVARNEHWATIAEKVAEKFDIPAEMERVKSHFHNRKKVLLSRIKDELKNVTNVNMMNTDEKIEELVRRKICVGEYEEQLARVCLDIDEEEKGRTDPVQFAVEAVQPMGNLFTETSHQSLLSQLLGTADRQIHTNAADRQIHTPSPLQSASSQDSDPQFVAYLPPPVLVTPKAPLLSKLLSDPSTSKENGASIKNEGSHERRASSGVRSIPTGNSDRKRKAVSPLERNQRCSVLPSPNGPYLSHLIVDVSSPQELKRLLSVLIDNGFSRFQHIGSSDTITGSSSAALRHIARTRGFGTPAREPMVAEPVEDVFDRDDDTQFWNSSFRSNEEIVIPGENGNEMDVVKDIRSRIEHVEVKVEPCHEEEEEDDEEVDEQTAALEAELATEAMTNGLALFGKSPQKKMRTVSTANGDVVMAHCELCGSVIRLNAGGSKWNFYEHVMMKHSVHKPYKCSHCPYQAGRKVRVRQHSVSQHHMETDPIDMTTPEIRREWLEIMSKCFPEHQYGNKTIAARVQ